MIQIMYINVINIIANILYNPIACCSLEKKLAEFFLKIDLQLKIN